MYILEKLVGTMKLYEKSGNKNQICKVRILKCNKEFHYKTLQPHERTTKIGLKIKTKKKASRYYQVLRHPKDSKKAIQAPNELT